jgi:hypothetical protein
MIKIFISVRNRLGITKKCIEALKKHSTLPHHIYVYDNSTNYLVAKHFAYFCEQYIEGNISQVTFTTKHSTFNAFSKASTFNFFGRQHQEDPKKGQYNFIVCLDNDIIVMPDWDKHLLEAWKYVKDNKMKNIKVIGQLPGGIKQVKEKLKIGDNFHAKTGFLGGSGLWSMRPNFFEDVGTLDLNFLIGHDKKHDQHYWKKMQQVTREKPYIMGIGVKLGVHCGKMAGSVCNRLTQNKGAKNREKLICFEKAEENIDSMTFEQFFQKIHEDQQLIKDW